MDVDVQERLWENARKAAMKLFAKALNVEVVKQVIDEKTLKKDYLYHLLAEFNSAVNRCANQE